LIVVIILLCVQQCEPEPVEIFVSPIMQRVSFLPVLFNAYDFQHWRADFGNPNELNAFGYELGNVRNNEPQVYTSTMVSIESGYLVITGNDYTSGSVFTNRTFTGGTFTIRAQFPHYSTGGDYCWGAIWLLGDDSCCAQQQCTCAWSQDSTGGIWAETGELDIAENWWGWHANAAHWGAWPNNYVLQGGGQWLSGWHTYTLEWLPSSVTFYVDGVQTLTVARAYDDPMRLIVNLAMTGDCNGQMLIDWIEWNGSL